MAFLPTPKSAVAAATATNMAALAAEAVAAFPAPPPAMQAGFGNMMVSTHVGLTVHPAPQPGTTPGPTAAAAGQLYIDAAGDAYLYNGSAWKKLKYDT